MNNWEVCKWGMDNPPEMITNGKTLVYWNAVENIWEHVVHCENGSPDFNKGEWKIWEPEKQEPRTVTMWQPVFHAGNRARVSDNLFPDKSYRQLDGTRIHAWIAVPVELAESEGE